MKFKTFLFCLLLIISTRTFAVYDTLSIDITPTASDVQFCFNPNYSTFGHTYLAIQTGNDILFLSPTQNGLNLEPWLTENEPSIFLEGRSKAVCLGPYPKDALQGISVYAGVGVTLVDLLKTGNYAKIFGGFPSLPQPTKDWTVMVYVVGSDLESGAKHFASKDIVEMLKGSTTTDKVNIVMATGGSQRYGWNTVKRLFIHNGQQDVLEDLGQQSMATPQTLSDFVQYAQTNFPARHYALILWNHGGGTLGYGKDQSNAGKNHIMNLTELHQAYQTMRQQMDNPLDIVVYDACLMSSIEVAEITATITNVMAGSAESEPGHGLDYEHLLKTIAENPPENGIDFGKIVKTGYLQHSQAQKTFNNSQITYSVLDLTQLPKLWETLDQFATELNTVFTDSEFFSTEMLSRGIIRAPGYPSKEAGKLLSLDKGKDNTKSIRIDFYNVLQTVSPDLPQLKSHAEALQTQLQQLVVDYETNDRVKVINPEAGRISLDIGSDKPYLSVLPAAYTQLSEVLDYYNQKRKTSPSLEGTFVCPGGIICADAKWLNLKANKVVNIDGYYGQQAEQGVEVFLIKPLYRYQTLEKSLEIGVNGQEACQYQLCVSDMECSSLTMTENNGLRLADVVYNEMPAVLTLCPDENANWTACSVLPQQEAVWGRDEPLSAGDTVIPTVIQLQNGELIQHSSQPLTVGENVPVIKAVCDMPKAVITASYFGNNYKPQFDRLCDKGDCVCKEDDKNESCLLTNFQFRAGVRIAVD